MDESGTTVQDHFVKQRRNLVLITVLLVFYHAGKVTFEKINVLGNESHLDNPQVVPLFLGVCFFYFLWRYYAACSEAQGFSAVYNAYKQRKDAHVWDKAVAIIEKKTGYKQGKEIFLSHGKLGESIGKPAINFFHIGSVMVSMSDKQKKDLKNLGQAQIKGFAFFIIRIRSVFASITKDRSFGEYAFPYILALLAFCEMAGLNPTIKFLQLFHAI